MNLWRKILRDPLRKILLRMLILTEKKSDETPALTRESALLKRDIHVPPLLVAILSSAFLLTVLLFKMGFSWTSLLSLSIIVFLILILFIFYLKHDFPRMIQDDEAMMLLGTLTVFFVVIMGLLKSWPLSYYLTPLPAASILTALLLHPRLSVILTIILSMLFAMIHEFNLTCFLLGFFGGLAGTAAAVYIRTHRDFIRAGCVIALAHFLTWTAFFFLQGTALDTFLWGSLWSALNGFVSAVLALGLLPFLESFFSRVTPMKLLELADFNQPLLKRLMVEAPGTYHHSLIMATLAEAAARAIGANPLLCRVGAYYHDIGKLVKPEYFVENQGAIGYNPHENLAPALSKLVVVSHVKEGVALARSARLPAEIINFIPMHHGTSRIEYFYHQAKDSAQEDSEKEIQEEEVSEESYRYPGPRPETKETAILMLADSTEAAARTIEEPSHVRFKDLVQRLVRSKFFDGQLSDSPLTLGDLSTIQTVFANTLTSIYHARIEYPEENSQD